MSRRRAGGGGGCFGRLLLLLTLASLVAMALLFVRYRDFQDSPATPDGDPLTFTVPQGAGPAKVVARLTAEGRLLHSPFWPLLIREHGTAACIRHGAYSLPAGTTALGFLRALCAGGRAASSQLTVPEGWTRFHLAAAMDEAALGERGEILRQTGPDADAALRTFDGALRDSAEGLLFPDTYDVVAGQQGLPLLLRMRERFDGVWSDEATPERLAALNRDFGVTPYEVLIVASLVEREARVASERPRIARVFYNRIARRMRMQSDPTCTYSADHFDTPPTAALCRDPSNRYSTYLLPGLPPTPIAAVGRSSLHAALEPAPEPELLYFVAAADGTGRHRFAATLDEHNRNVRDYLQRSRTP